MRSPTARGPRRSPAVVRARVEALLAGGANPGRVRESQLGRLADQLDLEGEEVGEIREQLGARGVEVEDDVGKPGVPATSYENDELAGYTVDALAEFLREAARFPLLTRAEEIELAKRVERGDLQAKDKLVTHNLRLVVSVARRHQVSPDLTLLDLIQEGTLGLIRATEKFDWRKGHRFSTYATLWIRQAIQQALMDKARTIRLPERVAQRERKLGSTRYRLAARLGREPSDEELAAAAGLPVEQVREMTAVARTTTSLDRPVGDEETPYGALLPLESGDVGEEVALDLMCETVRRLIAELPQPDRDVIRLRYGIDDGAEPLPLSTVARQLGISEWRVRRIERRALERLALEREIAALHAA